jgi:hypothetical protein
MSGGLKSNVIGGGTPTDLPGTIGQLPVYVAGGLNARVSDSVYGQADSGNWLTMGLGSSIGAGQVSGTGAVSIGKGAKAWGDGFVAIGTNANSGSAAKNDGGIVIGSAAPASGKNTIHIGSALAFGTSFADTIGIGTQVSAISEACIAIGRAANANAFDIAIGDNVLCSEPWGISIGYHASISNSGNGTGSKNIAIGYQATAGVSSPGDQATIAIGRDATCTGAHGIAIGTGASVSPNTTLHSISIGHGATTTISNTCTIGDTTNGPINKLRVRTAAATPLHIMAGASGALTIRDVGDTTDLFTVDVSSGADEIRALMYDVTAAAMKRLSRGVVDSGGVGFRLLRIPN